MSRGITLHEKEMRLVIDMVKRTRQVKSHAGRSTAEEQSGAQRNEVTASDEDIQITGSEYAEQ